MKLTGRMDWNAFQGCESLTGDVTIPPTLKKLNSDLFKGCKNLTGTLTISAGPVVGSSYGTPFTQTYFSTIVNNSSNTFSGPDMLADDVCACYVDANGAKATDIATGTYTRQIYDNPVDISGAVVTGVDAYYAYTGSNITPTVAVTLNGKTLTEGEQYTVSYYNNRYRNGTATVTVKGYAYNGYTGSVEKTFQIVAAEDMPSESTTGSNTESTTGSNTGSTTTTTSIAKATVSGIANKTYTGKAFVQAPTVKLGSTTLKSGTDYTLGYKNNVNAGTATVTITGKGSYTGSLSKTFTIAKAANALKASAKTATVKKAKVKKKAQTLAITKCVKFASKGQGPLTYGKKSGNKKIAINKKTGKVTVKKGLGKGTYKVKVAIKAAGNANYKAKTVNVTFKVKVK